jgi:hypothetical protein
MGLPRSNDLQRLDVLSDASQTEPAFVATLRSELSKAPPAAAYLFRGNVDNVRDVLVFGFIPGWGGSTAVVKTADKTWKSLYPNRLLAMIQLNPELEDRVSSVCTSLF